MTAKQRITRKRNPSLRRQAHDQDEHIPHSGTTTAALQRLQSNRQVVPGDVLHLQNTIGNRATGKLLRQPSALPTKTIQRFQIEGPFNKNEPVHEVLTLQAIKGALEKLKVEKKETGDLLTGVNAKDAASLDSKKGHNISPEDIDKSAQQFIRGVVWPDDPKSYLFDSEDSLDYSTGVMWYEEFDSDEKDEQEELEARSHYGDLQFFHGMATKDNEKPQETKARILNWSRFLTEVATGRIAITAKLQDIPLTKELFPKHGHYTVAQLFGYPKGKETEIRQRAAGAMMHMIQDSNAEGHTERDSKSGGIHQFHAYEEQEHSKHNHKDVWVKGSTLGERIKKTPGAERAIQQCIQVLTMLDQGAKTEDVIKFLDEQIFALEENAQNAGPGAEFKKGK